MKRSESLQRWAPYGMLSLNFNDRLICHECGDDFAFLASHVWQAHGYTSAAYRERFGLAPTVPLCSPSVSANKRRASTETYLRNPQVLLKAQIQTRAPEVRAKFAATYRERIRKGFITPRTDAPAEFFDGSGLRAMKRLRENDPEWAARERERHSVPRGGRVTVNCRRCGSPFETYRSAVAGGEGKHCPPCRPIALTERGQKLHLRDMHLMATDPEYRAKRRAQLKIAARINGDRRAIVRYCTNCGSIVPRTPLERNGHPGGTVARKTCSAECRREIRRATARASAAKRVAS